MSAEDLMTLGEVAAALGCQWWHVVRLYQRKLLPEPPRVGKNRVVRRQELPVVRSALKKAGYLK